MGYVNEIYLSLILMGYVKCCSSQQTNALYTVGATFMEVHMKFGFCLVFMIVCLQT